MVTPFQQGATFNNDIALLRFSQTEAEKFSGMLMCWLIPQIKNLFFGQNDIMRTQQTTNEAKLTLDTYIKELCKTVITISTIWHWFLIPLILTFCVLIGLTGLGLDLLGGLTIKLKKTFVLVWKSNDIVTRSVLPRHHVARLLAQPRHWLQLLDRHLGERETLSHYLVSVQMSGDRITNNPLIIWCMVSTFCSLSTWKLGSAHLTIEPLLVLNFLCMKTIIDNKNISNVNWISL